MSLIKEDFKSELIWGTYITFKLTPFICKLSSNNEFSIYFLFFLLFSHWLSYRRVNIFIAHPY